MHIGPILDTLAAGRDLDPQAADDVFDALFAGELTPAQTAALLMGLRAKSETADELASGVRAALRHARLVPGLSGKRIDTCGTGGDNRCSFNCSTAVALLLAGMGYTVVKHGNRAVSSSCGSADVIEALGLPLETPPEGVADQLARRNFVFLFAPLFHPAFRHVMPVRRELGCRTLFNVMGPLLNPARPTHQILGVPDTSVMERMARVLALTGVERAAVVHGAGGFDELTPFGTSHVVWLRAGGMEPDRIDPEEFGCPRHAPGDVAVSGKEHAVAVMRDILSGSGPAAMRDMVALNAALALHLLEDTALAAAFAGAKDALSRGVAGEALHA